MFVKDNETYQRDIHRALIRRVLTYAGIILAIIVVFTFLFHKFRIYSNARLALREAKNVKMSLDMINTEYYAIGVSIYDDSVEDNLKKGARDYVFKIQGNLKGDFKLTGYDSTKRLITGLEYETDDYIVRYSHVDDEDKWQVCLIDEILSY